MKTLSTPLVKILIIFCFALQIFPPLFVQDITSLRHFWLALFCFFGSIGLLVKYFDKKTNVKFISKQRDFNPLSFISMKVWLALIVCMPITLFWAINPIEGLATWNRWIIIFLCSYILCILCSNSNKAFDTIVICAAVVTIINIITCIVGYYYFDVYISQRRNLMINGGYGNKNIFAVCFLLKLPLLYYIVIRYNKVWKIIALTLIFMTSFCLIILSTRSSFIGLFLQIIIVGCYVIGQKLRLKTSWKYVSKFFIIIVVALMGFVTGNKFIEYNYDKYASKTIQNNYTVAARVKTIEEGNSKGRLLIWHNTIEIIKRHPIFGYGVGNHKLAIMQVEAAKKPNFVVSDHAHNDFLEMQSELGIIGELLYIMIYLTAFVMAFKLMFSKTNKEIYRLIALVSMLMLITYMNDALFNFPLERATPQFYLALSIALLTFAWYKQTKKSVRYINKVWIISIVILLIPVTYIETTHFVSSIVQHQRIICYNRHNDKNLPPSYWLNKTPWLPNVDESTKPIAINNASMFALEGDYRSAIDIILVDNANPYYGLKQCRLASYYNHLQMRDSAIFWANECIRMKPLCYDPVMIKASAYAAKGDTTKQEKTLIDFAARNPNNIRGQIGLIQMYLDRENYAKAIQTYQQALVNNPDNSDILKKKPQIDALLQVETEVRGD